MAAFVFPDAPAVGDIANGYRWDGQKWTLPTGGSGVLYVAKSGDTMTGPLVLPAAAPTLGTHAANKTYVDGQDAAAANAVTKKNYILNGAMMVSQENGTTAATTTFYYPVDNFFYIFSNAATQYSQQLIGFPTPGGSQGRLRVTCTAADTSVGAGDYAGVFTRLEGLRIVELNLGLASAKTVTLRFGVKAPAGIYSVAFRNNNAGSPDRYYIAEYTIAAGEANTDVVRTVTLDLDKTGVWNSNNAVGLEIIWGLMAGASQQGTVGSWVGAAGPFCSPNQYNFLSVSAPNNVFELFDVALTEGTVAPPFVVPDYASELAACQRYYWCKKGAALLGASSSMYQDTNQIQMTDLWVSITTSMRAIPTFGMIGVSGTDWAVQTLGGVNHSGFTATSSMPGQITATKNSHGLSPGSSIITMSNGGFFKSARL